MRKALAQSVLKILDGHEPLRSEAEIRKIFRQKVGKLYTCAELSAPTGELRNYHGGGENRSFDGSGAGAGPLRRAEFERPTTGLATMGIGRNRLRNLDDA